MIEPGDEEMTDIHVCSSCGHIAVQDDFEKEPRCAHCGAFGAPWPRITYGSLDEQIKKEYPAGIDYTIHLQMREKNGATRIGKPCPNCGPPLKYMAQTHCTICGASVE